MNKLKYCTLHYLSKYRKIIVFRLENIEQAAKKKHLTGRTSQR